MLSQTVHLFTRNLNEDFHCDCNIFFFHFSSLKERHVLLVCKYISTWCGHYVNVSIEDTSKFNWVKQTGGRPFPSVSQDGNHWGWEVCSVVYSTFWPFWVHYRVLVVLTCQCERTCALKTASASVEVCELRHVGGHFLFWWLGNPSLKGVFSHRQCVENAQGFSNCCFELHFFFPWLHIPLLTGRLLANVSQVDAWQSNVRKVALAAFQYPFFHEYT